jgi:hypothetical protein
VNRNVLIGIAFGIVIIVLVAMVFNGTRPTADGGTSVAAPVSEPATPAPMAP